MGFFGSILSKLGLREKEATQVALEETQKVVPVVASVKEEVKEKVSVEIPAVDVTKHLEELSAKYPGLNWKTSIVDLLKLLGIDSSYSFRKDLAKELGCPEDLMSDSAKMNVWLHKNVLIKIAKNGGNLPAELLG